MYPKQFRCGNCANNTYRIYTNDDYTHWLTVCTKCQTKSHVKIEAKMMIDWDKNDKTSAGIMCTGWSD